MGNLKDKRNNIALLEDMIKEEKVGFVQISQKIDFIMPDIFKIKKALVFKSKSVTGYEKELYYKISVKINLKNYMEYFNILDKHFEKKSKNINKIADENQKDKYELAPRNTAEITIGVQELPIYIKNKLKKYVYHLDNKNSIAKIYLRNKDEYRKNLAELKEIKRYLEKYKFGIKVYILCESEIILNMNKIEKREFVEFLNSY